MSDEDPHKRMRRFGELCGYFYGRRFFGLEAIMSDRDSDHMLWPGDETEEQITEALEQSGKCQKCRKLEDLLRWRDAWGEPPTEHGNYLVQRYEYYGGAELMVLHWNGKWPLRAISHWRPIGSLPGGE